MTPHVEKSKKYGHCISDQQVTGGEWGLRDYWEQTTGLGGLRSRDELPDSGRRVLRNPSPSLWSMQCNDTTLVLGEH